MHDLVLRHEQTHQQINVKALEYFIPLFEQAIKKISQEIPAEPVTAMSRSALSRGSEQIAEAYSKRIEPLIAVFKKELEIVGIGYRGQMKGDTLVLNVGFSHPVEVKGEEGVKIETPSNTKIIVSGISKERVGHVAAQIREVKKPEPYKGKGIRYSDERIIRKEGKTAGKK